MADLTRQSSRYRELRDYLVGEVKLREDDADRYAVGLVDEGFDSVGLLEDLTPEELMSDFGWKRGHCRQLEKYRKERPATPSGSLFAVLLELPAVPALPPEVAHELLGRQVL